jgi:spore cortex formation protein SpoVR/YcgB (stage V sporulation)
MNETTLDRCLALVADRRRRRLLEHLQHTGEVQIDDLVDRLYQAEAAADDRQTSRKQLAVHLNHTHLPKLAEYGVVDHDHDRGTVEYRPDAQIEAVLNGLPEEPSPASD